MEEKKEETIIYRKGKTFIFPTNETEGGHTFFFLLQGMDPEAEEAIFHWKLTSEHTSSFEKVLASWEPITISYNPRPYGRDIPF